MLLGRGRRCVVRSLQSHRNYRRHKIPDPHGDLFDALHALAEENGVGRRHALDDERGVHVRDDAADQEDGHAQTVAGVREGARGGKSTRADDQIEHVDETDLGYGKVTVG